MRPGYRRTRPRLKARGRPWWRRWLALWWREPPRTGPPHDEVVLVLRAAVRAAGGGVDAVCAGALEGRERHERDFHVTITDPARRDLWQQWIGTDTVCVRSPIPERVIIEGRGEMRAYILDEKQLDPAQRFRLCRGIAAHFQATVQEVEQDMHSKGIVVLADHCHVAVTNPQRWLP